MYTNLCWCVKFDSVSVIVIVCNGAFVFLDEMDVYLRSATLHQCCPLSLSNGKGRSLRTNLTKFRNLHSELC